MIFYKIRNHKIHGFQKLQAEPMPDGENAILGIFSVEEFPALSAQFHLEEGLLEEFHKKGAKFESFDGFDFVCLHLLDHENLYLAQKRLFLFLKKQFALFFCEDIEKVQTILEHYFAAKSENVSFCRLLYFLINQLAIGDTRIFDALEKEIMNLEQALITSKKRDCVKEIISLRKQLMILKKYYEQLLDVLEDLQENENAVFDQKTLHYFHILEKRTDRLYHNVLNLRDSVTQIRETYQAEVDISLNETMKLFTVLTAIFLPLTLIVGWYGMNLQMPEYHWRYGYLMVILLSILVIFYMFYYFKKKKWF